MKLCISRTLAVLLAMSLAGTTEVAQAWQTTTPAQQQQTAQPSPATAPATQDSAQQATSNQQTQTPAQTPAASPATTDNPAQQAPATDNATPAKENNASDPTHVPPPAEVLPNAPEQEQPTSSAPSATQNQDANQNKTQQPLGTAAAEKGVTRGGAASRPAGTAVAGKKQNQSRGLLIKVGAVLAAGAALGTVYALSRSTTPVPPGAPRSSIR